MEGIEKKSRDLMNIRRVKRVNTNYDPSSSAGSQAVSTCDLHEITSKAFADYTDTDRMREISVRKRVKM